jgi:hypothetical protein
MDWGIKIFRQLDKILIFTAWCSRSWQGEKASLITVFLLGIKLKSFGGVGVRRLLVIRICSFYSGCLETRLINLFVHSFIHSVVSLTPD